jgi:hypothetical protein
MDVPLPSLRLIAIPAPPAAAAPRISASPVSSFKIFRWTRLSLPAAALISSLVLAGCGAAVSTPATGNDVFSIGSDRTSTTTARAIHLSAVARSSSPVEVDWSAGGGDPETGPGSIDSSGVYTPPTYLSQDSVSIRITASLRSDPSIIAVQQIELSPSISLAPENLALTPGSQTRLYASIAEISSGSVRWSIAGSTQGASLPAAYGSFSEQRCQTSHQTFTRCSVLYTAPASLPVPTASGLYVRVETNSSTPSAATARLLLNDSANVSPLANEALQRGLDVLGTSGGNANDTAAEYCCGGTLGALVSIAGNEYILGNNHVLARSDQAAIGESILQPGLIDTDCGAKASYPVGNLSYFPSLQDAATNVDLALAQTNAGNLDPSGSILGFGPSANGTPGNAPLAGDPEDITLSGASIPPVVKSGRTTGLTCDAISNIAVDLTVTYNTACDGSGKSITKLFTNQLDIQGGAFSDSGDSGAIIADQQTAQPVGLLFAGNTTDTFVNPVRDVLQSMNQFAVQTAGPGATAAFVGGAHHSVSCLRYDTNAGYPQSAGLPVTAESRASAQAAVAANRAALLSSIEGLFSVDSGVSQDAPGEAAILLYVDQDHLPASLPQTIAGLRTVVIPTTAVALANGLAPLQPPAVAALSTVPRTRIDAAIAVKQRYSATIRRDPAVFGIGVGKSRDNSAEPAITIFVDRSQTPQSALTTLGGFRVQYLYEEPPRAYDWKHTGNPSPASVSCSPRSLSLATTSVLP